MIYLCYITYLFELIFKTIIGNNGIITSSEKRKLSTFDVVDVGEVSSETMLPFGSVFTLGAG